MLPGTAEQKLQQLVHYVPRINYVLQEFDKVELIFDLLRTLKAELLESVGGTTAAILNTRTEEFTSETRFIR